MSPPEHFKTDAYFPEELRIAASSALLAGPLALWLRDVHHLPDDHGGPARDANRDAKRAPDARGDGQRVQLQDGGAEWHADSPGNRSAGARVHRQRVQL